MFKSTLFFILFLISASTFAQISDDHVYMQDKANPLVILQMRPHIDSVEQWKVFTTIQNNNQALLKDKFWNDVRIEYKLDSLLAEHPDSLEYEWKEGLVTNVFGLGNNGTDITAMLEMRITYIQRNYELVGGTKTLISAQENTVEKKIAFVNVWSDGSFEKVIWYGPKSERIGEPQAIGNKNLFMKGDSIININTGNALKLKKAIGSFVDYAGAYYGMTDEPQERYEQRTTRILKDGVPKDTIVTDTIYYYQILKVTEGLDTTWTVAENFAAQNTYSLLGKTHLWAVDRETGALSLLYYNFLKNKYYSTLALSTTVPIHGNPDITSNINTDFLKAPVFVYNQGETKIVENEETKFRLALDKDLNFNLEHFGGSKPEDYHIVTKDGYPANGTITSTGLDMTYTPDKFFWGTDLIVVCICNKNGDVCQEIRIEVDIPKPIPDPNMTVICQENSVTFFGETYDKDDVGISIDTVTYIPPNGDALWSTLTIDTFPRYKTGVDERICYGESYYINGQRYYVPVPYTGYHSQSDSKVYSDKNGCDSTVSFKLTFLPPPIQKVVDTTILKDQVLIYNDGSKDYTYDESGTYYINLEFQDPSGCDSLIQINLTILGTAKADTTIINRCEQDWYFLKNGERVTDSGVYLQDDPTTNNITEYLSINYFAKPDTVKIERKICWKETTVPGIPDYKGSGTYIVSGVNGFGCQTDTAYIIDASVLRDTTRITLCPGQTNTSFYGKTYNEGTYEDIELADGNGCFVLHYLEVIKSASGSLVDTIRVDTCLLADQVADFSYSYDGNTYSAAGLYKIKEEVISDDCTKTTYLDLNIQQASVQNVYYQDLSQLNYACLEGNLDLSKVTKTCDTETCTLNFNGDLIPALQLNTSDTSCYVVDVAVALSSNESGARKIKICEGETIQLGDKTISEAGEYEYSTSLSYYPQTKNIPGYAEGRFEKIAFDYLKDVLAYSACDVTEKVDVSFIPTPTRDTSVVLCEGDTFTYEGNTYNKTGKYRIKGNPGDNSCDSVLVLNLTFKERVKLTIDTTIVQCEECTIAGLPEENAFKFEEDIQAPYQVTTIRLGEFSCVDTLYNETIVTKKNICQDLGTKYICSGGSITVQDSVITAPGTYRIKKKKADGCYRVFEVRVVESEKKETAIQDTTCSGIIYREYGFNINTTGKENSIISQELPLTTKLGCDSTILLKLFVRKPTTTSVEATKCEGEDYVFDATHSFEKPGKYDILLSDRNGCDSLVILDLKNADVATRKSFRTICQGDTVRYDEKILDKTGNYGFETVSASKCTILDSLYLQVYQASKTESEVFVCGDTRYITDTVRYKPGKYTIYSGEVAGCPDTTILTVTKREAFQQDTIFKICPGESVSFLGKTFKEYGQTRINKKTSEGCDSIYIIDVQYHTIPLITLDTETDIMICQNGFSRLKSDVQYADSIAWISENEYRTDGDDIIVDKPGTYILTARDIGSGCTATDTVVVSQSSAKHPAEFLVPSEIVINQPLIAADITNPLPNKIEWIFDDESIESYFIENQAALSFSKVGTYTVGMLAYYDDCTVLYEKTIKVVGSKGDLQYENQYRYTSESNVILQSFTLSPNPNDGNFKIVVELDKVAEVMLYVHRSDGTLILDEKHDGSSLVVRDIELGSIPAGLYQAMVVVNGTRPQYRTINFVIQ